MQTIINHQELLINLTFKEDQLECPTKCTKTKRYKEKAGQLVQAHLCQNVVELFLSSLKTQRVKVQMFFFALDTYLIYCLYHGQI